MHPYAVYLYTKFQGTHIMRFHLMATLFWQKQEEKNEETKSIFESYISEMPGMILLQIGMWGTDGGYIKNCPVL